MNESVFSSVINDREELNVRGNFFGPPYQFKSESGDLINLDASIAEMVSEHLSVIVGGEWLFYCEAIFHFSSLDFTRTDGSNLVAVSIPNPEGVCCAFLAEESFLAAKSVVDKMNATVSGIVTDSRLCKENGSSLELNCDRGKRINSLIDIYGLDFSRFSIICDDVTEEIESAIFIYGNAIYQFDF